MAEENIKDFVINWMIIGLLITCLISFAVAFMFNNNPGGFGDDSDSIFSNTNTGIQSRLLESSDNADVALNITANTNPEASDLGSRDSVATSYELAGNSKSYWEGSKEILSWVFSGDIGKMLLAVFGGIIGYLSVYYIIKFIRNGI